MKEEEENIPPLKNKGKEQPSLENDQEGKNKDEKHDLSEKDEKRETENKKDPLDKGIDMAIGTLAGLILIAIGGPVGWILGAAMLLAVHRKTITSGIKGIYKAAVKLKNRRKEKKNKENEKKKLENPKQNKNEENEKKKLENPKQNKNEKNEKKKLNKPKKNKNEKNEKKKLKKAKKKKEIKKAKKKKKIEIPKKGKKIKIPKKKKKPEKKTISASKESLKKMGTKKRSVSEVNALPERFSKSTSNKLNPALVNFDNFKKPTEKLSAEALKRRNTLPNRTKVLSNSKTQRPTTKPKR
jgi:UPF0716 family protein affecting phage T7 exclusion